MKVAGVDEVGRGPLAGPVVTAAVILPESYELPGLTDSKKLTATRREALAVAIKEQALSWNIASASVNEIDELNILHATMLAMQRAVTGLSHSPDHILVDGNRCPDFGISAKAIVGGDGLEACISAASIIAKVSRDALMCDYAKKYPHYGFEKNSGYPTAHHRRALELYGACEIHRPSYAPVRAALQRKNSQP